MSQCVLTSPTLVGFGGWRAASGGDHEECADARAYVANEPSVGRHDKVH